MERGQRRIGMEQEFFLVDETGVPSNRADEFLQACHQRGEKEGVHPRYFVGEWVKGMIEVNTPPAHTPTELARSYLKHLKLAIAVGKTMGLRLYPLASYPLHLIPAIRDKLNYHLQVRTVGYERFLNAGKCTGTHLHLEVAPNTIDPRVGVSYESTAAARAELVNIYNLATALDSAAIALSRSCPYYEGKAFGLAYHIVRYRGSDKFGWEGVYTHLPSVGGLMPYADSVERLVELHFQRYYAWMRAMDEARIDRDLFGKSGGSLLKAGWNPVRLNNLGTVEMRAIDSNYPQAILATIALIYHVASRVQRDRIAVQPKPGVCKFELNGDRLSVPPFEYMNGELLYAAVTEGVNSAMVKAYLDSILEFAADSRDPQANELEALLLFDLGQDRTTEAEILAEFPPVSDRLSREEGLRLVRFACDRLEEQVDSLSQQAPLQSLPEVPLSDSTPA
ncbi:glutamate-cysteine ligase family protein [Phormidium sp. CCY1219]|uniref:glutamate-cysteine ligase family protein n=1 Tax=Phormidium sp. CCY1219 TaxID=2886104 RepID=UPI002D1F1641|nr:glutamate-cysteine ligase family protein [Phormidium sp. CCY1219]MEB3829206.1 glutamate--cysteine ligase [Phormidium sp. CCY1219]